MEAFGLLLLTVFFGWLTVDAFRSTQALRKAPFSTFAHLWKGGLSHLSVVEQSEVKEHLLREVGTGHYGLVFLVLTLVCAGFTVRAFLQ